MSTEAFGETLQFITKVKLDELEKRRQGFSVHAAEVLAKAKAHGDTDPIERLSVLVKGMEDWSGAWSPDMNLEDIKRYMEQARRDPGFPRAVLYEWIGKAEAQIKHESTRYDYAQLFGNLLTDWLKESRATPSTAPSENDFEKVNRKETLEQKEKLESLIFEAKDVDVGALEAYLRDLFSSTESKTALEDLRRKVKEYSDELRKKKIEAKELQQVIRSVLRTDVLSEEKQATLKEFLCNSTVVKELVGVLNMQLSSIKTWTWPREGVMVEPRRHLNGKTRFYLDTEILTCLLLHYFGMLWSTKFKCFLSDLRSDRVWKLPPQRLTRMNHKRRDAFFAKEERTATVGSLRQKYQKDNFFMCQLPLSLDSSTDNYGDDTDDEEDYDGGADLEPRFDTPVNLKQSLLQILSADVVVNKTLHGQCTVVRTDLEWFGPSLPFATIMTILKFFGMPEEDMAFVQTFLSCPILFKNDPANPPRTRKRGVPISYMLSTLCGELVMFIMDFAVNQRADGLCLYRIHDDFWFWDADTSRCASAWGEMQRYATLAGLKFNEEKTGSVMIGSDNDAPLVGIPEGEIRWGFLRMDANGQFVIDQVMIDDHIVELRRQLSATTSVFSWTQAYNKYMAFVVRNCGAPAIVYGVEHVDGIIDTLSRIQKALFSSGETGDDSGIGTGSFVNAVSQMLERRFDVRAEDIPYGWYLWPNAAGGLEVKDPFVDLFLLRNGFKYKSVEDILKRAHTEDEHQYAQAKRHWDSGKPGAHPVKFGSSFRVVTSNVDETVAAVGSFFDFDEFVKGSEERSTWWYKAYKELLEHPKRTSVDCTPQLKAALGVLGDGVNAFGSGSGKGWDRLSPYWQWVIGLHHDVMVKTFGSLAVVEPASVPGGMVSVFKGSRMKWEQ
ncbi:hypothetical protein M0805_004500 [Coniferiporia weirii]|nr:hypothetical protein M0805_004500 [Coniferiporia weirii]